MVLLPRSGTVLSPNGGDGVGLVEGEEAALAVGAVAAVLETARYDGSAGSWYTGIRSCDSCYDLQHNCYNTIPRIPFFRYSNAGTSINEQLENRTTNPPLLFVCTSLTNLYAPAHAT